MIGIIDYGVGNLYSVKNAFDYLGTASVVTDDPNTLDNYRALILPGVGSFTQGMALLKQRGFVEPIYQRVEAGVPFLGICLGMQLLFETSEEGAQVLDYQEQLQSRGHCNDQVKSEHGTCGLSLIPGKVIRFPSGYIVPHVGWSQVELSQEFSPFDHCHGDYFYFVHSYRGEQVPEENVAGYTRYQEDCFPSIVKRDNVIGTQFHPEKSSKDGLEILRKFGGMD